MELIEVIFSLRFMFWFFVGGAITYWLLDRKGKDPLFGAVLCGILAGFGGIFLMIWIWLWMYYLMPGVAYKVYHSKRWKIRW
jgi:hypothetical protein